jgi:methylmalonyl-CoA mutase
MLRGTVAAFSAGIGAADSIAVQPFTAALGLPDVFARRVARNTQLILLEESHLWRVADPAAGAGGFEALTQAFCEQGWRVFQDIEQQKGGDLSGIVAAFANGHLQTMLAEQRAARAKAVASRRAPITGTSEFPHIAEKPVSVLDIAPVAKSSPQPAGAAARDPAALLQALIGGAGRAEGLIHEEDGLRVAPLPSQRLAEPFEALRNAAEALPQRPTVFLAALGSVADFTARAGFARNFFETGGLVCLGGGSFAKDGATDLDALVNAFRASGAKLACLCGADTAYAEEGAAAAEVLAQAGAAIWLAGRPGESEAALNQAGVSSFIFAGCDAVEALERAQSAATA